MGQILHRSETGSTVTAMSIESAQTVVASVSSLSDWRRQLPVLTGKRTVLRELRPTDATSLFTYLTAEEVTRHVSAPPSTVEGFERFISWVKREQAAGRFVCYAITLVGEDIAVGIMQVRLTGRGTAECGAVVGEPFWGTGAFEEAAGLVAGFAFKTLGAHRLEARVSVDNERCLKALRRIGAVQEGVLRQSLSLRGERHDQVMFSLLEDDYVARRVGRRPTEQVIH